MLTDFGKLDANLSIKQARWVSTTGVFLEKQRDGIMLTIKREWGGVSKLVVGLVLALVSTVVTAEWSLIQSKNSSMDVYISSSSIRRNADLTKVKMWVMFDQKKAQEFFGDKFLSSKVLFEYDCNERLVSKLYITHYSDNMGHGVVIYSDEGTKNWEPIAPETLSNYLWRTACGKQ